MDDPYTLNLSKREKWFLFTLPLVITVAIVTITFWAVPDHGNNLNVAEGATLRTIVEHGMPR
jgi:hypothetical protein